MTFWPYQPHVTWITESTALAIALMITALTFFRYHGDGPFRLDWLGTLLAALIPCILVSTVINSPPYFTRAIVTLAFLTVGTLLSVSIKCLQAKGHQVLPALAWGLFFGAIVQTLFGYLQITGALYYYQDITEHLPMWVPRANPLAEASGLIFQKNQLANYLVICSVAAIYLVCTDRLRKWQFVSYSVLAGFIIACTASRTALLYPIAVLVVAFLPTKGVAANLRFRNMALIFSIVTLAFQLLHPITSDYLKEISPKATTATAVDRLNRNQSGGFLGYRSLLWEQAIELFEDNPLLGVGPGNYSYERAELQGDSHFRKIFYRDQKFFNHAHNLFFHSLATYGGIATLILLFGLIAILREILRSEKTPARDFVLASFLVIMIHSQFEHPLWFAYFVVLFVTLVSSHSVRFKELPMQKHLRTIAIACLIGMGALAYGISDYSVLTSIVNRTGKFPVTEREREALERISRNPLLAGMADIFIIYRTMDQTDSELQRKLQLAEKTVRFRPVEFTLYRYSIYLAYAGRKTEALETLRMAFHLAPSSPKQLAHWFTQAPKDQRLAPLGMQIAEYYKKHQQYEQELTNAKKK